VQALGPDISVRPVGCDKARRTHISPLIWLIFSSILHAVAATSMRRSSSGLASAA
jgi:hypothetical protein